MALSHLVGLTAILAGVVATLLRGSIRRIHPAHYVLMAFVGWMVASYMWSVAPAATITKASSCVQLLAMTWLIWQFAPTKTHQYRLLAAYVLGTLVSEGSLLYAFVTHTGSNLGLIEGRYTAAGFDENELGVTLALGLAMSSYLIAQQVRPFPLWIVNIPVAAMSICLTGSRGGVLAMGVALLAVPPGLMQLPARKRWLAAASLFALIAIAVSLVPNTTWARLGTMQSEFSRGTLTNRTRIWSAGLEIFREHPLLGVGSGAFGESVYSQLDIVYVAHNSYLSVLVELGFVGAFLFFAVLAAIVWLALNLRGSVRIFWLVLLGAWGISVSSLTWEHRKPTWFLFGMLITQSAACGESLLQSHLRCRVSPARALHYFPVGPHQSPVHRTHG